MKKEYKFKIGEPCLSTIRRLSKVPLLFTIIDRKTIHLSYDLEESCNPVEIYVAYCYKLGHSYEIKGYQLKSLEEITEEEENV